MDLKLQIKLLNDRAIMPVRAHSTDSGLDLFACLEQDIVIASKSYEPIPTGIAIQLPTSDFNNMTWEATIRPRSGLAFKHGVMANLGTIDTGFVGEIKVLLYNFSYNEFTVTPKMKIAQLVIQPVALFPIEKVTELETTDRGENGFGSTGL